MSSELRRSFRERAREKLSFSFRLGRPGSVEVTHPSNPDDSQSTRSAPSSVSGQDPDPAVSNPGVSAVTGSQESGTGSVSTATQQEQEKKSGEGGSPKHNTEKRKSRHLTQPKGTITYEVSGSDTLASIAAQFDTTTSELKKTNKLMTSMVFPGQILYIPDKDYVASEDSSPTSPASPQEVTSPTDGATNNKPASPTESGTNSPKYTGKPAFDWRLMTRNKGPGLAERQKSTDSPAPGHIPPPSEEQVKQLEEECSERFIKVNVKYITDGQGVVSGVLLVTPNAIMFDPNVSDPLVIERGAEEYGMIAPMDTIISAAMYHDIAAMNKHKRSNGVDGDKPIEVYHDKSCPLYKEKVMTQTETENAPESGSSPAAIVQHSESVCSCGATDRSPDMRETSASSQPSELKAEVVVASDAPVKVGFSTEESDAFQGGAKPELGESPKHVSVASSEQSGATDTNESPDMTVGDENTTAKKTGTPSTSPEATFASTELAKTSSPKAGSAPGEDNTQQGLSTAAEGEVKPKRELVPRPATHYEDLPLYLCLRVGLPYNKKVSKTCPIESYMKQKHKPEYWFCIPRDKVDHLYAFFLRWSPSIYGSDDEINAKERGFVVINGSEDEEDIDIVDDHFDNSTAKTRHVTKDWEIVNLDEARRRLTCAEVESLPLPELSEKSNILTEEHIRKLCLHLPARAEGYPWTLIYSSEKHGFSLKTLYRTMQKIDCPVLIIVKDTSSQVFGAMLPCAIVMSDHFYGTGESFLFSFYGDFKRYGWSGVNNFFIKGNADSLSVGAGQGLFGLWLDGDLYHGRTQSCETYENDLLTVSEDFVIQAVEAWGFI